MSTCLTLKVGLEHGADSAKPSTGGKEERSASANSWAGAGPGQAEASSEEKPCKKKPSPDLHVLLPCWGTLEGW